MASTEKEGRDLFDHAPETSLSGKTTLTSENTTPPPVTQDPSGAKAPETQRPSGRLLSAGLRHDAHGDKLAGLLETRPGQAAVAAPELGRTCRECLYWGEADDNKRDHWGELRASPCKKYMALTGVAPKKAYKLEHRTCACRSFSENRWPPRAGR